MKVLVVIGATTEVNLSVADCGGSVDGARASRAKRPALLSSHLVHGVKDAIAGTNAHYAICNCWRGNGHSYWLYFDGQERKYLLSGFSLFCNQTMACAKIDYPVHN